MASWITVAAVSQVRYGAAGLGLATFTYRVVVAGESVVENGEITGALPGGLVRGPQTVDAG